MKQFLKIASASIAGLAVAALAACVTASCVWAPRPGNNPGVSPPQVQPRGVPGGADYKHGTVRVEAHGDGAEYYWLYEPADPKPATAPVIVFLHGWGALDAGPYEAWLRHLCRRGNIVIYPKYQASLLEPPENFAPNAAAAVRAALARLEGDEAHVTPQRFNVAFVGHSAGAVTAANLAADCDHYGLPRPRAAMPVQPGGEGRIPFADFGAIGADCLLLCVYGDSDAIVGSLSAKMIFLGATTVPPANKNLVEVRSDNHGDIVQVADHFTPCAPNREADFFDWYGYWKLLDGLTDAAFFGVNREYALGNTPQQRFMGLHSDGHPVAEMRVTLGHEAVNPADDYVPAFDATGEPWDGRKHQRGHGLRDLIVHRMRLKD